MKIGRAGIRAFIVFAALVAAPGASFAFSAIQKEEPELRRVPLEAYTKYCQGVESFLNGRLDEAEATLQEALKLDPNSPETHVAIAQALRQLGHQKEALEHVEEAARLAPDDSHTLWELGNQYLEVGDHAKGTEYLDRAVALDPDNFQMRQALANIYARIGDMKSALRQWEESLNTTTASNSASFRAALIEHIAAVHEQLAEKHKSAEEADKAIEWYRKALPLSSEPAALHRKIGELLVNKGDASGAVEEFLKGLEQQPGLLPLRYDLADSYLKLQQWDKAYEEFKRYVADAVEEQRRIAALLTLIRLADRLKKPEEVAGYRTESIKSIQEFVKTHPDARYYAQLGSLLFDAQQYDEAISAFRKASDLSGPKDRLQLGQAIAEVYEKAGKPKETEDELRKLQADFPESNSPALLLADFLKRHNRLDEAIETLQKAVPAVSKEESISLYVMLANYYSTRHEDDKAVEQLKAALAIAPESPIVNNHLGYVYAQQGVQLEEAVELVKKALASYPEEGAFLDSLAWAYYKLARFDAARVEIERAIQAYKGNPDSVIRNHYGDILWALEQRDAAREQWKQALADIAKSSEELDPKALQQKIDNGLEGVPKPQPKPPDAPAQ